MTHRKIFVLIVAAGTGSRLGSDTPKQYLPLGNSTPLRRCIETFQKITPSENIRIVINPDHIHFYEHCTNGLDLPPPIKGGNTRQDSVNNGLNELNNINDNDIVLIHDAARPLLSIEDLEEVIRTMESENAACLVSPVNDTLYYGDNSLYQSTQCTRDQLYAMQTPQAFRFDIINKAHKNAPPHIQFTDDTALVRELGIPVKLVVAKHHNFKITRKEDLSLAEHILSTAQSTEFRTGIGFDVHAFDDSESVKSIRLCGVDIPFDRKLKGHSDADVGLHALTDAILGAIGEGDIGLHFPPSDMTFKNMDSAIFLKHAMKHLHDKNAVLVNADITLICERPKIGEHRDLLRNRVAEILEISADRVNIKATTTEKLGFTGRKEGIAAQAAVSVKFFI